MIAFDPGPTPGTGLSRDFPPPLRVAWSLLGGPLGRLVPRLNSRELVGTTLADLATGRAGPPQGSGYASLVSGTLTWPAPSVLARSDAARDALWRDSAALVDLAEP